MQIEFHPRANEDLETSLNWYSSRSSAAARNFLVAVDLALESIRDDPNRFSRIDKKHQACSVTKFPFQIVYHCDKNRIVVVAIAHAKRKPGYWQAR